MTRKLMFALAGGVLFAVLICWALPNSVGMGAFLILAAAGAGVFAVAQGRSVDDYADRDDD